MAQFARPDADLVVGNFTDEGGGTVDIFLSIDEATPSDADYIESPTSPASEVYACSLSDINDPASSSSHIMRMRTATDQDNEESLSFTQELRQGYTGEGAQGTLIASQSRTGVASTTFTDSAYTLSGAEADAITNYADLQYRFVVTL